MMWALYILSGTFAGLMSGMLGLGGGIVVVPALVYIFIRHPVIPSPYIMQMAVGTSLAIMVVTLTSSLYAHHKRGSVDWPAVKKLIISLCAGVIMGALIVRFIPSHYLSRFFSLFLLVIAGRILISNQKSVPAPCSEVIPAPHFFSLYHQGCAAFIGVLSSLLGVGGGTMWVPFFLAEGFPMRMAVGTSVACGISAAIIATVSILMVGHTLPSVPWSTSYIYWPAFLGISIMSVLFAPIGVKLAHKLPQSVLKKVFAILIILVAIDMMFMDIQK